MIGYLARRILLFIPTLLVISWIAFGLSTLAPGDPVTGLCGGEGILVEGEYERCARAYRYDRPPFYFSLAPAAYPDTLHRILPIPRRIAVRQVLSHTGNWEAVSAFFACLDSLSLAGSDTLDRQAQIDRGRLIRETILSGDTARISFNVEKLREMGIARPALLWQETLERATPHLLRRPDFTWFGLDNRYHHWLSGWMHGDLGVSYSDKRPVFSKIRDAIGWTLLLNGLSFFFALGVSIPLGAYAAVYRNSWFDRLTGGLLFFLYAIPRFWLAILLVVFFTSGIYAGWMDIFPSIGLGDLPRSAPWQERFWERAAHLVLPVFCETYALLAFFSRQMRGGMLDAIHQQYIHTARAKGLPEGRVIWKHAFRNALFPVITVFASLFPASIAGSVVIEVIFAIPGMGLLMYDAVFKSDWPVVFAVLAGGAVLTMVGILVADLLYAWADPRVELRNKTPDL